MQATPVRQSADRSGLPVLQPTKLDEEARKDIGTGRPDFLIVVAYGLILPDWLLEWPRIAPINVHASLLPRWRGASPMQQAILTGDPETGISIMRMTPGLDRGPVYRQCTVPIGHRETAGQLHDRLAQAGATLLEETLPDILAARDRRAAGALAPARGLTLWSVQY